MMESIKLFILGFSCIASIYEISKTSKSSKSERIRRSTEKLAKKK